MDALLERLLMNTLAKQLKQAFNALAYADIGERVGQREKYAALNAFETPPARPAVAASSQWIALGVGGSLPAPVMSYVISACQRMRANLLLIGDDGARIRALLAEYLPNLRGIDCMTEEVASDSTASVLRAMNLYRGLLFAVSGTEDDPLRPFLRARRAPRTPVPIVLVSEKPSSVPEQSAPHRSFTG